MGFLDKLKNLGRKDDQQADQGSAKTEAVGQDKAGDTVGADKPDTAGDGPTTPPTS